MSLLCSYTSNSSIPNRFNIRDKFQISEIRWTQIWMAPSKQQSLTGTAASFLVLGGLGCLGFFVWLLVGLFFGWFGFVLLFNVVRMLEGPSFGALQRISIPEPGLLPYPTQAPAEATGCNTSVLFYPHSKRLNLICEKWSQNTNIL